MNTLNRYCFLVLAFALAPIGFSGCDDDGEDTTSMADGAVNMNTADGSVAVDSNSGSTDSAAPIADSARGDTTASGLVGGDNVATATAITVGQTGTGSVALLSAFPPPGDGAQFFRFTPPASGNYTITLTGDGPTVSWCGANPTEGGCLCDQTPPAPFACCDIRDATQRCIAVAKNLVAGVPGYIAVANTFGPPSRPYTVTITPQVASF